MTREEAIEILQEEHDWCQEPCYVIKAIEKAIAALRPISREQVEKVYPGCGMCSGWNTVKLKPCANGDLGMQLASGYVNFPFCPFCGKPQTDEAVQMVMERLEALHGET